MTVCIAAISGTAIIGASDRLVTYGDTEYEQSEPKILQLASNTVALTSGSPEAHVRIHSRVSTRLVGVTDPTVDQIAEFYAEEFALLRRQKAERKYLTPLGLTTWSFLNNQTNLTAAALHTLMEHLAEEDLGSEAIIAGVDQSGPHIYVVEDPGEATCYDMDGWAAIGSGFRHADQQFIRDKYHRKWAMDEAFLLTYLAKKRADITPGVGPQTDMFFIGPGPDNRYTLLGADAQVVQLVRQLHADLEEQERELADNARAKIRDFFTGLAKQAEQPANQEQVDGAARSARTDDAQEVRGSTTEGQPSN